LITVQPKAPDVIKLMTKNFESRIDKLIARFSICSEIMEYV